MKGLQVSTDWKFGREQWFGLILRVHKQQKLAKIVLDYISDKVCMLSC